MSDTHTSYEDFSREELIARLLDRDEDIQMGRAFSHISEDVGNDATLQWQGRNRFLSEKVIPVQLEQSDSDSLFSGKGDHRIINGDNLSVMTSLLTEFRGGRNKGVDVIYLDPPYNQCGAAARDKEPSNVYRLGASQRLRRQDSQDRSAREIV